MSHTLYTILPNGQINESKWHGSKSPPLDILQRFVGGYIQIVPGFTSYEAAGEKRRCIAYCDEDGLQKQLVLNFTATKLWTVDSQVAKVDPNFYKLFGPVVITVRDRK